MQRRERLKADAEAAFRAALAGADPRPRVADWLRRHPGTAEPRGRLAVVAVGKAACAMAAGVLDARPQLADTGLVVTKDGHGAGCPEGWDLLETAHPRPDHRSLSAGAELLGRAGALGEGDELLLLVSGGASALVEALPEDIPAGDWFAASEALVGSGLDIEGINAVRKHCSRLKGGRLAAAAAPARVTALLLSDVIRDDPAVIGSGLAAGDASTFGEALALARSVPAMPATVIAHLERGARGELAETPRPDGLGGVTNAVVATNHLALEAAGALLGERGYRPLLLTSRLQGEAREVARVLAAVAMESRASGSPVPSPAAFLWGGEPWVTLSGEPGVGGRAQELALALADELAGAGPAGGLCAGTDGTDGPTGAAGGWADDSTRARAEAEGWPVADTLTRHDSGSLLEALGDRLVTGPTGTNVMDLMVVLTGQPR